MNKYWNVTVSYRREQDNGKLKLVTEKYLVAAISPTDAEAKITSHLKNDPFEWKVKSVVETKILAVIE